MLDLQETVVYEGVTYYIVDSLPSGYWVVSKEDPKTASFPLQTFLIPQR